MKDEILSRARQWTSSQFDKKTVQEVEALIRENNEEELIDRFYKNLEFGTGGMRGIMASGTNRMNIYTIGRATQGLANYLLDTYDDAAKRGVSIAYDSRNNSKSFAREAARVLAANRIRVFLFTELRPTPLLSFTVQHLKNVSGIVITASHNPKEYNGYKVYSPHGYQVTPPEDRKIVDYVNSVDIVQDVKRIEYEDGLKKRLIREIGSEMDKIYLEKVHRFARILERGVKDDIKKAKRDIRVVFTPLHGTGITLIPEALKSIEGVVVLNEKEQSIPDGNFPTTLSPNPEETSALSKAIDYAKEEGADLVIATDPDCDRLGCAVPDGRGGFTALNGNQIGSLFAHLIASSYRRSGVMPENPVFISTVVSTELTEKIAEEFGVDVLNVLTGFKYIGEKMYEFERLATGSFLYAFEESYGYLADTFVRDKDGVIASVLCSVLAKYAIGAYGSILEYLHYLYDKYGMYQEYLKSFYLKGVEGVERIRGLMQDLRDNPPRDISGSRVVIIKDYLLQKIKNMDTGEVDDIKGLPESNVLQFYTDDDLKVSIRPSGTEPKIKFYFAVNSYIDQSVENTERILDQRYRETSTELFKKCGLDED